ncbi:MAG: putative bifunctional diguanylate cyclase/phosphodiesterase, partial [Pseudonocardia sp.]
YRYTQEELLGRPLSELIHPEDLPRVQDVFTEFLDDGAGGDMFRDGFHDALRVSCRVRAADGTWLPTESTISRYSGPDGAPARLLVTTRDLSEQAALQRQVAHLTFHDGLTGLPNRSYFEERIREVLSRHPSGGEVAVVFVDLDGFTAVNDSGGHAAGDQVLAQAARRLRANVLADDTVARWGGDEFAVLVQLPPDDRETRATVELAGRLLRVLSADPYQVGDKHIVLTASVGIAFAGDEERPPAAAGGASEAGRRLRRTAADLMRNGDLAMARAKELGGGRVEVYAPHMHADVVRRLELGSDLQRALAEEQFAIEFQPVVDLATSRVTGVEALLRWRRGSESVPPEEFIGPAEEAGLMVPLGGWVLREACREVARWRRDSWAVGLSVNLTARQIAAPRFVESVAAALEEAGLPPHALTLEVREEVLVEDAGQNVERLVELRDLGVRLAIDDFGTGYSSLAQLRRLTLDTLKIDRSFITGIAESRDAAAIVTSIIAMAHAVDLTVVAEGVETAEQFHVLRGLGVDAYQGWLFSRPLSTDRLREVFAAARLATP